MRLPSLCGGAIYLVASVRLCWLLYGNGLIFLVAVALMTLNPFVLDYLSLARGYGLAIGFFTWGLLESGRSLETGETALPPSWRLRRISKLLALTVLSNLTFLLPCTSFAILFTVLLLTKRTGPSDGVSVKSRLFNLLRFFVLPGSIFVLRSGNTSIMGPLHEHFYWGEDSAIRSISGLIAASLAHHRTVWPWDTSSGGFQSLIEVLSTWGVSLRFVAAIALFMANLPWRGNRGKGSALNLAGRDAFVKRINDRCLASCP